MSIVEDLEKLKQLKDNGAITETEFEIEKQKVLGSINTNAQENNKDRKSIFGLVGFILGLVSILAWYIPLIGFPVAVCGIVFSCLGMKSQNRNKAIAGLVLSIIFLVVTVINSVMGVVLYSNLYYWL